MNPTRSATAAAQHVGGRAIRPGNRGREQRRVWGKTSPRPFPIWASPGTPSPVQPYTVVGFTNMSVVRIAAAWPFEGCHETRRTSVSEGRVSIHFTPGSLTPEQTAAPRVVRGECGYAFSKAPLMASRTAMYIYKPRNSSCSSCCCIRSTSEGRGGSPRLAGEVNRGEPV